MFFVELLIHGTMISNDWGIFIVPRESIQQKSNEMAGCGYDGGCWSF